MARARPNNITWSGIAESGEAELPASCGVDPITTVVTCAVGAVARLGAPLALVGCTIRQRSPTDVATMLSLTGGRIGSMGRWKMGRPRRRWEAPWAQCMGSYLWRWLRSASLEWAIGRLATAAGGHTRQDRGAYSQAGLGSTAGPHGGSTFSAMPS